MREEEGRRDGKEVGDLVGGRKRDREKDGKEGVAAGSALRCAIGRT